MRLTASISAATLLTVTGFGAQASQTQVVLGPASYNTLAYANSNDANDYAETGTIPTDFGQYFDVATPGPTSAEFNDPSGLATAKGYAQIWPYQRVQASGSASDAYLGADTGDEVGGEGEATLIYFFEVIDEDQIQTLFPVPLDVDVDVRVFGNAAFSGQGSAGGYFTIYQPPEGSVSGSGSGETILDLSMCAGASCAGGLSSSINFDQGVSLLTNTVYSLELAVGAGADSDEGQTGFTGGGTAFLDPYFAVDPSVADPSQYELLFSPGIINSPDNVGSAPEASTWAMRILGFAGLGAIGFSRRRGALGRDGLGPLSRQGLGV
jgi:hypothetical protein